MIDELGLASLDAARIGAAYIRSRAADLATLDWREKARADFVSDVDVGAESRITEHLRRRFPGADIVGEELSPAAVLTSDLAFVVDPLDGTTNFLHGVPWYAVTIAALLDGEVIAGATINVATGELFTATLGGGARRAGEAIRVSEITEPGRALIGTGLPWSGDEDIARYMVALPNVMRATAGIRRSGAAALDLADVACGRYDAFWELRLNPWDMAAGSLLVREAGGVVTTASGEPCPVAETSLVCGNPAMHAWLLDTLRSA